MAALPVPTETSVWFQTKSLLKNTTTLYIGPDKAHPTHVLAGALHMSGKSDLFLHADATTGSPVIASAASRHTLGLDSDMTLSLPGAAPVTEKLAAHMHLTTESYNFVLKTPAGDVERFEWRLSHGDQVKALNGWKWGFKLVRCDHKGDPATDEVAKDHGEIVAAFAEPLSMDTEIGRFKLMGSAARGELGDAIPVAALLSAVRIWQLRWYVTTIH